MKRFLHATGRGLQLLALLFMPSSIWVGWMSHDEAGCLTIFLGSIGVFALGYILTRLAVRI